MDFLLFSSSEPIVVVVEQLLSSLKTNVTKKSIKETILSHPEYPSLLSVSDSLNKWNIDNASLKLHKESINELPCPFIAHVDNGFTVVTECNENIITYYNENRKVVKENTEYFKDRWSGIVLLAEKNHTSGEIGYKTKQFEANKKIINVGILIALFCFVILKNSIDLNNNSSQNFMLGYILVIIYKITGTIISSLLILFEIDKHNPLLKKVCGGNSKKTNCNAILNSSQSKLFNWLSWSEIGFIYFIAGCLLLQIDSTYISYTSILSTLSLPYVVFSITYQWKIAKQWCPLCLAVQTILILEFVTYFSLNLLPNLNSISIYPEQTVTNFLVIIAVFLSIYLILKLIKPLITDNIKLESANLELNRLKSNPEVFNTLSFNQKTITSYNERLGLILGNSKSANTLIKVCNPYCDPCSKAHPELEKLLNSDIKIQIIYNATNMDFDITQKPVKHLLSIYESKNEHTLINALHDWYSDKNKDYDKFSLKYPTTIENDKQSRKVDEMSHWCNINEIMFTPTYFFNGKQLPSTYQLSDVKNLLN